MSIFGHRASSPSETPYLDSNPRRVALSTGLGRQKAVAKNAFVGEDTVNVRDFVSLVSVFLSSSSSEFSSSALGRLDLVVVADGGPSRGGSVRVDTVALNASILLFRSSSISAILARVVGSVLSIEDVGLLVVEVGYSIHYNTYGSCLVKNKIFSSQIKE